MVKITYTSEKVHGRVHMVTFKMFRLNSSKNNRVLALNLVHALINMPSVPSKDTFHKILTS